MAPILWLYNAAVQLPYSHVTQLAARYAASYYPSSPYVTYLHIGLLRQLAGHVAAEDLHHDLHGHGDMMETVQLTINKTTPRLNRVNRWANRRVGFLQGEMGPGYQDAPAHLA